MFCYNCMRNKGDQKVCPYCGCENIPEPAVHHLPAGTVVGNRYTLGRVLGEGGFGITYIGYDGVLDVIVAVKEYYPYGISHRANKISNTISVSMGEHQEIYEKGKSRFLSEAKNIARFRNEPGIVTVTDFLEENNTAYIVMEYLDGVDLRQHLRKNGAISVDKALTLLLPVIKSLDKMHAAGIIHRDISPDNIMVLKNGSVKLMDFGAARNFVGDNRSMSVMLKKGYAPAEQYRTNGKQGPWTDVYGICATIYRCITGKTPQDSLDRNHEDHLQRPSALGVKISPELENVLMYGLAVRREDRCQTMAELYRLLSEASGRTAAQAAKPTPPAPVQREQQIPRPSVSPVYPVNRQNYNDNFTQIADENAYAPRGGSPDAQNPAAADWQQHTVGSYRYSTPTAPPPPPERKKSSVKVPIIIGSIAAVLIITLVILLIISNTKDDDTSSSSSASQISSDVPPQTEAPATAAPATTPPATNPPPTEPPATNPPPTSPPATESPVNADFAGTYNVFGMKSTEIGDYIINTDGYLTMWFKLNADGTGTMSNGTDTYNLTWTSSGNTVTMTDDIGESLDGTITNGVMVITVETTDVTTVVYLAKPGADTSGYNVVTI